jgi:putative ABC transport system permease protein
MLSLYRTLSLRYLKRRRARAILIVFSIAVGVAAWVATSALIHSLKREISQAAIPLSGAADLYVSTGNGVPLQLRDLISLVPGVAQVRPIIIHHVVLPDLLEDGKPQSAVLLGVERNGGESPGDASIGIEIVPRPPANLSLLLTGKPAFIGEKLEASLGDKDGQLSILVGGKPQRITVVGILKASGPAATLGGNVLAMDLPDAAAVRGRPGLASRLEITLERDANREEARQRIASVLNGKAQVSTPESQNRRINEVLKGLEVGFTLSGWVALVVGMFLVYNSLAVSVAERRHDIGIMRSLGATREQIRSLFLGEAAVLGVIGSALGIPLGLGLAELSLGPMQRALQDLFLPMRAHHIDISNLGMTFVTAALAGISAALAAALIPSSQAATEEPADAVRRRPPSPGIALRVLHVGACLLLLVIGLIGIVFRHDLPQPRLGAYAGPLIILVACLLGTPFLTSALARAIQPVTRRLLGVEARLAADNLLRAPTRTGLVIGTLAAGIALIIQTAGLIKSNEVAIDHYLQDTVRADAFLTAGGPLSGSGQSLEMGEDVRKHLLREYGNSPDFRAVAICWRHQDWEEGAEPIRILLVAMDAGAYYTAHMERGYYAEHLDLFRRLAEEPGGAVASQNFLDKHGKKVGDTIVMSGARGPVPLRILGAFVDYSWNMGTLFVDRLPHEADFNTRFVDVYDCYLPVADPDKEAFRKRVQQSSWGAQHALYVLTREELYEHIRNVIRRLYGLAYTQQSLVVIVVALGVMAALLISVIQRQRELGLLRAVGATRGQVIRTVVAEAFLMGIIGTLLGLLIGLPLEWYVVHILLFDEAGFEFPAIYPWASAGFVAASAMILAALAAQIPALQAGRLRIAEAIAYE